MESRVLVTVGIPTYNRLHYLKEAVASAIAQTYSNIEILISQNPHAERRIRDEIAEYCQSLAARDPRVRYELRSENLGPSENHQWVFEHARGDYVMLIGDDDRLLPSAIENLVSAILPGVSVVFGRRYIIDAEGRRQARYVVPPDPDASFFASWPYSQYEVPPGVLRDAELWAWRQAMGVEASIIKTEVFRRVRYRHDLDIPDFPFFVDLARKGDKFFFVPEHVNEYRFHPNSTTGRGFVHYRELFDYLEPLSVRPEIEPYKGKFLRMLAFRAASKALLTGDVEYVRRLLASRYYPADLRTGSKGFLIKASAALPGNLGAHAYSLLYAIRFGHRYKPASV
ncbi:MAG: glycosyltransferase family 2 protein [Deltaproteobacteria bacterium]|nr:glycosyltransferase family 2 protein [Deltaproteobacteria bacterium]